MFDSKYWKIAATLYLLMAIGCFGPATVQSEKAQAEYLRECREQYGQNAFCVSGSSKADGLPKALFWPLWLSYMAASST